MKNDSTINTGISAPVGMALAGAVACAALLLFLGLSGCSSSTEPPPPVEKPAATFEYSPPGQGQSLRISETMDFSVSSNRSDELSVKWYRHGVVVGQDTSYTFVPDAAGKDTLQISAFVGAVRDTYYWQITVEEDVSVIPPEVTNVVVRAGPEPADVTVEWARVSEVAYPLVEYMVAISYDGTITEANWDQATILDRIVPVPNQIRYTINFTENLNGMVPGAEAWFAVRVVDDRQQLSPLTQNYPHDITWPWYLGGFVYDEIGRPLLGVILDSSEGAHSSNTDANGFFLFDRPFRNIDKIRVGTNSPSWYDFVTGEISVEQDTTQIDITLINKHGLDDICYGGDFLDYVLDVTGTRLVTGIPGESRLWKWEQYPVSVFIPAGLNDAGIDMEQAGLDAMDFWNTTMANDAASLGITETDYFVRTADEAGAGIVYIFEAMSGKYGETSLALPDGLDDELGKVIPEKINIRINTDAALWKPSLLQDVSLHEMGHALGILWHPSCTNVDYLMTLDGALGSMDRGAEAVHLDERRTVRTIRNLPQGVQMSSFTGTKIEFK